MEILNQGMDIDAKQTVDEAGNPIEQRTVVRFQKGVDFEKFEDFCGLFLSILKSSELPGGHRTIKKLIESDTPSQLRSLPSFGALSMTIPNSALDFAKLHTRIRESEITIEQMGESRLDVRGIDHYLAPSRLARWNAYTEMYRRTEDQRRGKGRNPEHNAAVLL